MNKMIITNEEQLFELLARLSNNEDIALEQIDLTAFTQVKFKITGEEYQGTITSSLCYSLTQFHDSLLRLYCLSKYKDENLARLTEADKQKLELTFEVKEGCTLWGVDFGEIASNIGSNLAKLALEKMNGTQLTIISVMIILALTGIKIYNRYSQKEEKKAEITENSNTLAQFSALTEKMQEMFERSQEMYIEHLKTYKEPQSISVSIADTEVKLNQADIHELTKRTRRTLTNEDGIKEIEIESIKKTIDKLVVTARLVNADYTFPLYVDTSFIEKEETDLLFDAFKNNLSIRVLADFKSFQGKIEKANASSIFSE